MSCRYMMGCNCAKYAPNMAKMGSTHRKNNEYNAGGAIAVVIITVNGMAIYASEGITATNNTIINTGFIGINFNGNNNLIQNNYIDTFWYLYANFCKI